jgi:hypothetical protein
MAHVRVQTKYAPETRLHHETIIKSADNKMVSQVLKRPNCLKGFSSTGASQEIVALRTEFQLSKLLKSTVKH